MRYPKWQCQCCGKVDDRTAAGLTSCEVCAAKDIERVTRRQQKLKSERRCIICGAQDDRTLSGKGRCTACAQFAAAKQRLRYRARKEAAKEGV